jgi:hypothetical protein
MISERVVVTNKCWLSSILFSKEDWHLLRTQVLAPKYIKAANIRRNAPGNNSV